MNEIREIPFAVIGGIGTRLESPTYFVKPLDECINKWAEILVRIKTHRGE